MRIFFGFDEGAMAETAWIPEEDKKDESES